jgi:hypothetical protein
MAVKGGLPLGVTVKVKVAVDPYVVGLVVELMARLLEITAANSVPRAIR